MPWQIIITVAAIFRKQARYNRKNEMYNYLKRNVHKIENQDSIIRLKNNQLSFFICPPNCPPNVSRLLNHDNNACCLCLTTI